MPAPRQSSVERTLFYMFLVALPVARWSPARVGGFDVLIPDVLFALTALVWGFGVLTGRAARPPRALIAALGLWFGAAALSAAASEVPAQSAPKLAGVSYLVAVALVTASIAASPGRLRGAVAAWLGGLALSAAAGVAGVVLYYAGVRDPSVNIALLPHHGSLPDGPYPRIQALLVNPNMLCNYLSAGASLLVGARLADWVGPKTFGALAAAVGVAAAFTLSPGLGGAALAAGMWGWVLAERPLAGRAALATGVLAAAAFLAASAVALYPAGYRGAMPAPLAGRAEPSNRALVWSGAARTFGEHPVLGRGLGLGVADVDYTVPSGVTAHLADAHNVTLSLAGQEGLAGLAALAALVAAALSFGGPPSGWRAAVRAPANGAGVMRAACAVAFVDAFIFQGLTGSFEDARHLWALLGVLAASRSADRSRTGQGH